MRWILALFIITGCQQSLEYKPSEKSEIVDDIMRKAFIQLQKEKELSPFGTGAQMMDEVKMLALAFSYCKEIELEDGRELLIAAINTFLETINADTRILPYLKPCPFEPKNVQIRIFLRNRDGSPFASGKLCFISAINGTLQYDIHDPQTTRLKTVYEEPYEEALAKIRSTEEQSA